MNIYRDSVIPFTQFGGVSMSSEFTNFGKSENWVSIYAGEAGILDIDSIPGGNRHPVTWRLPMKAGGLSCRYHINGTGAATYNGVLGYPGSVTMTGEGTISNAEGSLLAYLIAELIGSGTLSASSVGGLFAIADMMGVASLVMDLTDGITREDIEAAITASAEMSASIAGGKGAEVSISGSAALEGALGALAGAICEITTSGSFAGTPSAFGHISATITPFTELSPEGLARAVWEAVATEFNTSGTMGQKLNSASTGGVDYEALGQAVWEYLINDITDDNSAAEVLKKAKQAAQNAFAVSV